MADTNEFYNRDKAVAELLQASLPHYFKKRGIDFSRIDIIQQEGSYILRMMTDSPHASQKLSETLLYISGQPYFFDNGQYCEIRGTGPYPSLASTPVYARCNNSLLANVLNGLEMGLKVNSLRAGGASRGKGG